MVAMRLLMPRVASHVERLGDLIAFATHDFWLEVFASFPNPFSICQLDPFLTCRAPRIGMKVGRVILGPEEANTFTLDKAVSYVLADKGLGLRPMCIALDGVGGGFPGLWSAGRRAPAKDRSELAQFHAEMGTRHCKILA
jgi:hypothetical protein